MIMFAESSNSSSHSNGVGDFSPPYFEHVLAEFALLNTNDRTDDQETRERIKLILEKQQTGCRPSWGDLYLLEKYVICKQPEEVLKARLPGLRLSYREIVGQEAYEQYLQSGQASLPASNIESVRADACRLLDTLHWAYAMAPERERTRTMILKKIALQMVFSLGIGVLLLSLAFYVKMPMLQTVILVMFMGALGGYLSVQQRIASISNDQDPILTMFQLQSGLFAVRLAPITGAICGLALFLIFHGDLLQGNLFPKLDTIEYWLDALPATAHLAPTDYPEIFKLLLWCFIAGFAERLVPDTLDNLVSAQARSAQQKKSAAMSHKEEETRRAQTVRSG